MRTTHSRLICTLAALSFLMAAGGCSGDSGADGADGMNGLDGMDGEPGETGDNGMDGQPGAKGDDGDDGDDGLPGAQGAMGSPGLNGEDGLDGDAGVDGDDGEMGLQGDDGPQGPIGLPGQSGIIDRTKLTGNFVVYPLDEIQMSGVTGDVRFAEYVNGATHATLITVRVSGTNVADTLRVSHVHYNDVATGGAPVITLNKVDAFTADGTGMSETLVTHVDAAATNAADPTETFVTGAAITYQDIVGNGTPGTGLNGYVNVHKVVGDNASVVGMQVAAGDIGENF